MKKEILRVEDLCVYYSGGRLMRGKPIKAVDGINFSVHKGESVGIVGESGCGKSTTGYAITHLIKPTSGKVLFDGEVLKSRTNKDRAKIAKKIQLIFQNTTSSLNSKGASKYIIAQVISAHNAIIEDFFFTTVDNVCEIIRAC